MNYVIRHTDKQFKTRLWSFSESRGVDAACELFHDIVPDIVDNEPDVDNSDLEAMRENGEAYLVDGEGDFELFCCYDGISYEALY